jgi:nucleotide-binding universal stress UspA family protein
MATEPTPLLVGYDGSDGARRAIEHAGALMDGAPAIVAFVSPLAEEVVLGTDFEASAAAVAEASAELDAAMATETGRIAAKGARLAEDAGLRATPLAVRGEQSVWPALLRIADEHGASALVVGRRGLSGLRSALVGSVSHGIVHHSRRPVLIVPPCDAEAGAGPVILCDDGSQHAARAIARAGALLGRRPAIALTAWTSAAELGPLGLAALPQDVVSEATSRLDDETRDRAVEVAEAGAERARAAGFADVTPLAERIEPSVWATLAAVASARKAAAVVVAARGRSPVRSALLGSVSRGVVTHASSPVLVVPPTGNNVEAVFTPPG